MVTSLWGRDYCCEVSSECVTAWTDRAIRFVTPTFRSSWATCAFTVRSMIPSSLAISRFEQPATSRRNTSRSRSLILVSLRGSNSARRHGCAFNESSQDSSRYPDRAGMHLANRLLELIRRGFFRHVSFCAGRDGAQDIVVPHSRTRHDDAYFRSRRLERRHPGIERGTTIRGHQHKLLFGTMEYG